MWLEIKRVYSQHFRKYYFEASNSLGSTTHVITLNEGTSDNNRLHERCGGGVDGVDGGFHEKKHVLE